MKYSTLSIFLAGFCAIFPFLLSNQLFYGAVNTKFFYLIIFIHILLLFAAWNISQAKHITFSFKKHWFLGSLVLVLLVQYLAGFLGTSFSSSLFSDIIRSSGLIFLTHLSIGAVILGAYLKEGEWSLVRRSVVFSSGIFAFLSILGIEGLGISSKFLWFDFNTPGLTFGNPTFAGAYLLLALILGLAELSRTNIKTKTSYALIASLVLIVFSPILINTKLIFGLVPFAGIESVLGSTRASSATMLALLAFLGGFFLLKKFSSAPFKKPLIISYTGAWMIGIVAGLVLLFTPQSIVQERYIDASSAARIIVWEQAIEALETRPWLGFGPENFAYAWETHINNAIFLDENLGEAWFDRAHNIFLDTLITSGIIGISSFTLLIFAFWWTLYRAKKKEVLGEWETVILATIPIAHIIQTQTAFDTVSSYFLLSIIAGYILYLENTLRHPNEGRVWKGNILRVDAGVLALLAVLSFTLYFIPEFSRQQALFKTFVAQSHAERLEAIETSLMRDSDFETLRMSSASFVKGLYDQLGRNQLSETGREHASELFKVYDEAYIRFTTENPTYYRAHINHAYLLLAETILGKNRLDDAKEILERAYALSPQNPSTYAVHALAHTYAGEFEKARERADAGIALNPNIDFMQRVRAYIENQEKNFPTITVLRLENL